MNQPSITKSFWNLAAIASGIFFIGFLIIILIFPQLISPLSILDIINIILFPVLLIFYTFFILKLLPNVIKTKIADFWLGILIIIFLLGMRAFLQYIYYYCLENQITAILFYFIIYLLSLPFLISGGALLFSLSRIKLLNRWGQTGLGLIILSIAVQIFTFLSGPCFGPFEMPFYRYLRGSTSPECPEELVVTLWLAALAGFSLVSGTLLVIFGKKRIIMREKNRTLKEETKNL